MALLKVSRLLRTFGAVRAVDGVSFEVHAGEIYGLLGPNGAGKTTTLSMIAGLLKPEAGDIQVDGQEFWSAPARAKRAMGVVPQDVALYEELSGRENLEFWAVSRVSRPRRPGRAPPGCSRRCTSPIARTIRSRITPAA